MSEAPSGPSRRAVIRGGSAVALAFASLSTSGFTVKERRRSDAPLRPDPDNLVDLPEGFSYRVMTRTGEVMSDGFHRPGRPDGMACFQHPNDQEKLVLIRNHENWPDTVHGSPFGPDNKKLSVLPAAKIYDPRHGAPFFGGTTTMIVDKHSGELERDFISLLGTTGNCAGGATPWGSWLSCEESAIRRGQSGAERDHGFVFEVPIDAVGPIDPAPLKSMGRFAHEAASVDPRTGVVYMTEDQREGLLYRFVPSTPGAFRNGGVLQALAIKDWPGADTRNWPRDWSKPSARPVAEGQGFETEWITLDDVESPGGDLATRGHARGAAIFCRGEGMAFGYEANGGRAHYFNCTQGGSARVGQVWRYEPGENEGTAEEQAGRLTLIFESPGADVVDLCDNLAVTPWGDLVLCEDGMGDNYLRLLRPDGTVRDFARNAHPDKSEFCGACFSPDGTILFVNLQEPGFTLAVSGPWSDLA